MILNGSNKRVQRMASILLTLLVIVMLSSSIRIRNIASESTPTVVSSNNKMIIAATGGNVTGSSMFAYNDPYRWREQLIIKQKDSSNNRKLNVEYRQVLVIRVSTGNSDDNTIQEHEISNVLFYESSQMTVQKQMQLCSGGRIQLQPAGVINIDLNLGTTQISAWTDAIAEKVMKDHYRSTDTLTGYKEQLRRMADHVIIVLPKSKFENHNFVANAEIGRTICVFHPLWVLSLSAYMHEMGHNIELRHAGYGGSAYADTTGYMGSSDPKPYGPQKCYNAAQHWSLSFYDDKRVSLVDMDLSSPVLIQVAAFVDHEKISTNYAVLVQVGTNTYLQFNRAKSYNVDTNMMIDQIVLISDGGDKTTVIAGMDANSNAVHLSSATVQVCSINIDYNNENNIDYAVIAVGASNNNGNLCNGLQVTSAAALATVPAPTSPPIVPPTGLPITAPTHVPTAKPTSFPTEVPTATPTVEPTSSPVVVNAPVTTKPTGTPITVHPTTYFPTSQPTSIIDDGPDVWLPVQMVSTNVNGDDTANTGDNDGEIVRTKATSSSSNGGGILSNRAIYIPCIIVFSGIIMVMILVMIRKRAIHEHYAVSRSTDDEDNNSDSDDQSVFTLKFCDKKDAADKDNKHKRPINSDNKSVQTTRTDQMSSSSTLFEDLEASTSGFMTSVQNMLRGEYEFDFGSR